MLIYCTCTQYLVGPPFALITASIQRGMQVISLWHCWGGMEAQFPSMGTRTASPRGRYGERLSVTRVWRYIFKNTTCWPATAHDVTTGVPQYKCRREDTSSAFSSSLTDLFEACKVNLVRLQFSFLLWRALAKRLGSVWIRVLVIWHGLFDTHDCCVFLFGQRARTRCLWGGGLRALWAAPYEDAPLSPVPLFEERGAAVCFPRFKSHRCRGTEDIEIVGLAGGSSRWVWEGAFPFTRVGKKRERAARLWWCNLSDIIWSGG